MADISHIQFINAPNIGGHWAHHIYLDVRLERPHNINGFECWCRPTFIGICTDCEDGCWKCEAGSIDLNRQSAETFAGPVIVMHRP